jgi:hypothetical protein
MLIERLRISSYSQHKGAKKQAFLLTFLIAGLMLLDPLILLMNGSTRLCGLMLSTPRRGRGPPGK